MGDVNPRHHGRQVQDCAQVDMDAGAGGQQDPDGIGMAIGGRQKQRFTMLGMRIDAGRQMGLEAHDVASARPRSSGVRADSWRHA